MKIVSKIIGFLFTMLCILTMYFIYRLNILPNRYFFIISGIMLFFVFGINFKLLRKKTAKGSRVFFTILTTILMVGIIYFLTYINATYDFMNSLVLKDYETVTYHVIAKEDYSDIKELKGKKIAYLDSDSNYNLLKFLIRKDIKYEGVSTSDITSLIQNLTRKKTDAILLEDSHYRILQEEYEELGSTNIVKSYSLMVKKKQGKSSATTSNPFLVYISGIDTYGTISSVSRSDVNIIAAVNPNTAKILLVSIPRDYYVNLHSVGQKDKLTHAGIYGIDESVKTLEDLLGMDIDYSVRLNFSTLTKSIDLLGGIDVYSDLEFTPWTNPNITIKEGMNHMDGEMALAFARERHAYASGDRKRGENQQAIITAVIKKMTDKSNIMKYKSILSSLEGTFETSMSYTDITNLFKNQISNNTNWDITSISLDGVGSMQKTYSMGNRNLYVMIPDEESVIMAKEEIKKVVSDS